MAEDRARKSGTSAHPFPTAHNCTNEQMFPSMLRRKRWPESLPDSKVTEALGAIIKEMQR